MQPSILALSCASGAGIAQHSLLNTRHDYTRATKTISNAESSAGGLTLKHIVSVLFHVLHYFGVACSLSLPVSAPQSDPSCLKTNSHCWTSGPYTTQAQAPLAQHSNSPIFCWQENCCRCIPLSVLLRFPQQCPGKHSLTKLCHAVFVRRLVAVHVLITAVSPAHTCPCCHKAMLL